MFKEEVQDAVGPTQFGVAAPGGCVALRNEMVTRLLLDPSLAVAPVDLKNMYGSLAIPNTENEVIRRVPMMWPLLAPWIREPRQHVYKDDAHTLHHIAASGGLDQGDPVSALLAPLSIVTAHETPIGACHRAWGSR